MSPPTKPVRFTAAVSGVVTDATTGRPVVGALVYLGFQGRGAVGRLSRQLTDEKGRFVFTDLPPGANYFMSASKPGYLTGRFGTGADGLLGSLIALVDGQWFKDGNITMQRMSSISGIVTDTQGQPAVGAVVRVVTRIRVAGRTRLAAGATAKTDDRGVYRINDLIPGSYFVMVPSVHQTISESVTLSDLSGLSPEQLASGRTSYDPPSTISLATGTRVVVGGYLPPPPPVDGRLHTYPPIFHPGVTSITGATQVQVRAGDDLSGINVALTSVPATTIAGVVDGPPDALAGSVLRLLSDGLEELGSGSETATATLGADGRFALVNVPAGSYTALLSRSLSELTYGRVTGFRFPNLPPTPGFGGSGSASGTGAILSAPSSTAISYQNSRTATNYYVRQRVTVGNQPIPNLVVTMQRGSSIRGRIVNEAGDPFEVPQQQMQFPGLAPNAEPADGNPALGLIAGKMTSPSTFTIDGLQSGRYLIRYNNISRAVAISIMGDDGVDHLTRAFDTTTGRDYDVVIKLTEQINVLSGHANDAGVLVPGAVVVVFAAEQEFWNNYGFTPMRLRGVSTLTDGTYRLGGLPPGDYYVVGVMPDQADAWQDPDKLRQLAVTAKRVTMAVGTKVTMDVPIARIK